MHQLGRQYVSSGSNHYSNNSTAAPIMSRDVVSGWRDLDEAVIFRDPQQRLVENLLNQPRTCPYGHTSP